jgi:hypothetical protein
MLSLFYFTNPATAALTLRHHLIPAMEAFSWVIALQIFGPGSVGDQPLKKGDDPRSLGPEEVSPQERRRGRQACQALLLSHDRATGSFHYSSRLEAPGALHKSLQRAGAA